MCKYANEKPMLTHGIFVPFVLYVPKPHHNHHQISQPSLKLRLTQQISKLTN
jgi:hypothetical protein